MLRWLETGPRWQQLLLSCACIALAGVADHLSGADIAFTAIYLVPISLAAWALPRLHMLLVTLACAATWLAVDIIDHQLPRHPATEVINLGFELGVFLGFGFLLVSLRHHLEAARELARTDPLTGLANRRAFWHAAEDELERCRRFGQPFSIAYFDVDDFKGVNDRYGHRTGDELLQAIASTLQQGVRRVDLVARLGGDEFVLLLPGTGREGAAVVLDKLRGLLVAGLRSTFRVTCSAGCLTVTAAPPDVDELVAHTDAVMYRAKGTGRGEVLHEVYPAEVANDGVRRRRSPTSDAG